MYAQSGGTPICSNNCGSTVYMSGGKDGRIITAKVRSVKSASHSDAPYREYGDQWQSHMRNIKTALPKLVFK